MSHPPFSKASIVIEFSDKASQQAITWFINKVKADKLKGGCQLSVARVQPNDNGRQFLISASEVRMRVGAEMHDVRKKYKDNTMREFNFADEENFMNYDDNDFITDGECLFIIKSELDALRALDRDTHVPGHERVTLYPGKSILRKLMSAKLIINTFCLHNKEKLDKLGVSWYRNTKPTLEQPIGDIHDYFGDTISMYFAFLGFYTKGLVPLIILSVPILILSNGWNEIQSYGIFAALNIVWAAIFLEMWKRKSADIAYTFGNFQKREWEDPRCGFHGSLGINPITNQKEPCYPEWKRRLRICLISGPVVVCCIAAAVAFMFYYFSWDFHFAKKYDGIDTITSKTMRNIPSIMYCLVILIANTFYRRLAEALTDQENHRLESSYQNYLVTKIVLFDFVNNFLCLFYIAFIYNNVEMLQKTLRNLFIVQIIISQTLESVIPYWTYKRRARPHVSGDATSEETSRNASDNSRQIDLEIKRDIYDGTFDDYLELWLQFGYVVMFSCAFPLASILAFINNVVEIRSDAFKMSKVFRRPFSIPTRNIGAWQVAFECISYLGVVSNCALIFLSEDFQTWFKMKNPTATPLTILIWFICIEHILLAARCLLSKLIPEVPEYIKVAIAKMHYRSMQALKRERAASLHPSEILETNFTLLRSREASMDDENETTPLTQ